MADVMPVRTSTNAVEGINRCECGNVRTIHRAKGKRSKFLYSICDDCGTNQQTGKYWQAKFEVHYPTLEELHQAEQAASEPETKPEPKSEVTESLPVEPEQQTKPPAEPEPEKKPGFWRVVLTGVVLGGLTGGVITRLS